MEEMTTCTCDTFSVSSNSTVLTVNQTSNTTTATQVAYFHTANGSQPYCIFAESGSTAILGKTYTAYGTGVYGQAAVSSGGYGVYGQSTGGGGYGVFGEATGGSSVGVYGKATNTAGIGVYAAGTLYGASCTGNTYGVYTTGT